MNRKIVALIVLIIAAILFSFSVESAHSSLITDSRLTSVHSSASTAPPFNLTIPIINERIEVQEAFLVFVNDVAGIDLSDYNVTILKVTSDKIIGSQETQIAISAMISNNRENISVGLVFVDGKVKFYDLNVISGSLGGLI